MESNQKALNFSELAHSTITDDTIDTNQKKMQMITEANLGAAIAEHKKKIYPQYPARFLALIGFGFGSAMNGIVWISLVAITDEVKNAFDVSDFFLNM